MRLGILGGGMQGQVIARNLAARKDVEEVVIADVRPPPAMPPGARHIHCDALDAASVKKALSDCDAGVIALPSAIGKAGLTNAIRAEIPLVDISFTAETLTDLNDDAQRAGIPIIADCGVAPGLSHILAGHAYEQLGGLDTLTIRVGGIPQKPTGPFHHAIYFNPHDLLAEYYRPARLRRAGKDEAPQPLESPIESYRDREMGDHEAFVSDGLRTLLTSYPDVPEMIELTLRRPGHLDCMQTMRRLGFLDTHPLAEGAEPPVSATARILASRYPESRYPDYLLMIVEGTRGDKRIGWRLLDKHTDGLSAMTRTTGYTAAAVATQLAHGHFTEPGLHAPERLGHHTAIVTAILADLAEHGVNVRAKK